ncbi:SRPBCC family protein [Fluviicola sp.]|uniref:SRPBCC family protein n=1 Tax=Fluviicola sp. TaxID=1917219 RepID=UPI0031DAB447
MMYQIKRTQLVKTDLETCWKFFSAPENLQKITPGYMKFRVLTETPAEIYEGLIIAYKISPVMHIPLSWVTEITVVEDQRYFVDEQRQGPYKMWHHEHHFKAVEGGVEMTDIVSYSLPFGILGKLAHRLFVRKQLEGIFDYRFQEVEKRF